jgi:hypothetical protein
MHDQKFGQVTLELKPDAPKDEPCFVLRGQDILAAAAVAYYADLVEASVPGIVGRNNADRIRRRVAEMNEWPTRKLPD